MTEEKMVRGWYRTTNWAEYNAAPEGARFAVGVVGQGNAIDGPTQQQARAKPRLLGCCDPVLSGHQVLVWPAITPEPWDGQELAQTTSRARTHHSCRWVISARHLCNKAVSLYTFT